MNLLFNKPTNSDTLVAWHILAQAYKLAADDPKRETECKNLLTDKDAWKINESWDNPKPEAAAKLMKQDFEYLQKSWGLKLYDGQGALEALQDFARCVYGDGPITPEDVRRVAEALKAIFNGGAGK